MQATFQLQDCPIFPGSLRDTFPAWLEQQAYSHILVIADGNTLEFCLPVFLEKTGLKTQPTLAVVSAGEDQKNLLSCEKIWQSMLHAKLDRHSLVINLGGGVIGDMGGFCAATWKRGIDFVHVPTTLLAMTDAAIGGKLGVDFHGIKNIIGVFRQPTAVFVDPEFLETLPARELRSGFAEVIKHAMIAQQTPGKWLIPEASAGRWLELLEASIAVKVRIVAEDPHEKGLRMLLNFGHTIGHALESYFMDSAEPLTHGEAVAIGMICETAVTGSHENLGSKLSAIFGHRQVPASAFPLLWGLMLQDKKNSSGKVRIALPDELPYSMKTVEITEADLNRSLFWYNGLI